MADPCDVLLPKWDDVAGGESLAGTAPHEIDRVFFGHCRMESPCGRFDFAVDVTQEYEAKLAAYESVFAGIRRRCSGTMRPRIATSEAWWA